MQGPRGSVPLVTLAVYLALLMSSVLWDTRRGVGREESLVLFVVAAYISLSLFVDIRQQETIPFKSELEHTEVYLSLEQLRFGLHIEKLQCDYYNYLKGEPDAIRTYRGEYMARYSWAEDTLGSMVLIPGEERKGRMNRKKSGTAILLAVVLGMLLGTGCALRVEWPWRETGLPVPSRPPAEETEALPMATPEESEAGLQVGAFANARGELCLDLSAEDFIAAFNRAYQQRYSRDYLTPLSRWSVLEEPSPYFGYEAERYRFSADEKVLPMPTASLYMPKGEAGIYEILLTFDDHGYQEALYQEFRDICLCAFRVLLPELEAAEGETLFARLYDEAAASYAPGLPGQEAGWEIRHVFGALGLYSFYGGGTVNICILPMPD